MVLPACNDNNDCTSVDACDGKGMSTTCRHLAIADIT